MVKTINISIPIPSVRKDIFAYLESLECPKYTFKKMVSNQEGQFDVEDDGSHGDLCRYTKRAIHSTKFGNVIMFRVLYNGQFFDDGPILDKLKK